MHIRRTEPEDISAIMEIIAEAQEDFRARGIDQWQNGYPNAEIIRRDAESGDSYVLVDEGGTTVATAMITFAPDPNYSVVHGGGWLRSEGTYATIHRIAVRYALRGRGIAAEIVRQAERMCRRNSAGSIRIDTHRQNTAMQRLADKCGFAFCGIIHLADGAERLAYEKILTDE